MTRKKTTSRTGAFRTLATLAFLLSAPGLPGEESPAPDTFRILDGKTAELRVSGTLPQVKPEGDFRPADELAEGDELSFRMKTAPGASLEIRTGNAKTVWSRDGEEGFRIQYYPDAEINRSERSDHQIRGILRDSFAWDDAFAARVRALHFSRPGLADTFIPVRILRAENRYEISINGFFISSVPVEDLFLRYRNTEISDARITSAPAPEKFRTVDIAPRRNVRIGFGRNKFPANSTLLLNGIPFRLPAPLNGNADALDLSVSWCPFSAIRSDGDEFGGRWGGALRNDPSRIQFRVPQDDYTSLCVLAASQGNPALSTDTFTVQFYRPGAGFPHEFRSPPVPGIASAVTDPTQQIRLDGKTLSLIRIPLSAGILKDFQDQKFLEFELTKNTWDYQCYPDPFFYSRHAGGLPSSVKIFAVTLEKAPVRIAFEPEAKGNVWTEGETPAWNVALSNRTGIERTLKLAVNTRSFDGREKANASETVRIPAHGTIEVRLAAHLQRYGWHSAVLSVTGDGMDYTQERSLAYLRKQEPRNPDLESPGFEFGAWYWGGAHETLSGADFFELCGKSGMTATAFRIPDAMDKAEYNAAKKWNFRTYYIGDFWPTNDYEKTKTDQENNRKREHQNRLRRAGLPADTPVPANDLNRKRFFAFGTEPSFGVFSHGSLPEFYGEAELDPFVDHPDPVAGEVLSASQSGAFQRIRDGLRKNLPMVKKDYPDAKIMLPWGDPNFAAPFLRDPEIAGQIDGALYDTGLFDRMPEMQMHQCVIHRLWQFRRNWERFIPDRKPFLASVEGPCFAGIQPGALTERELASYVPRSMFLLGAYGMNKQYSVMGGSEPADYWGEQHYGGGTIGRLPLLNPHVAYASVATAIRHLKDLRFAEAVPFNEKSVYGIRFETIPDSKSVYALWTIRGERPVSFGKRASVFDMMDNEEKTDSAVLSDLPVFVYGLEKGLERTAVFGAPVHTDSVNGPHVLKIGDFGDGTWTQIQENDRDYTAAASNHIRRFPAEMELAVRNGLLEIVLPVQEKNRGVMPHYTTLVPKKSIVIPGSADSLNVPVSAHGDWGRILFVLRDAKNEKWISCGVRDEYNCDDTKNLSVFNFEGTRLLKIPLPGNLPWDSFRRNGTASWGALGGDERVDYPLTLEKVIVERREQFLRVNSLEKASREPVALGALYAEYPDENAKKPSAAALANVRENVRIQSFAEPNPIRILAEKAQASPGSPAAPAPVSKVEEPATYNDGTNGIFHFPFHPDALEYDIYVSRNEDGRGAQKLAGNVKSSPVHVRGFKAETDFYVFLVYRTKDRKQSAPSTGFRFRMKKNFANL